MFYSFISTPILIFKFFKKFFCNFIFSLNIENQFDFDNDSDDDSIYDRPIDNYTKNIQEIDTSDDSEHYIESNFIEVDESNDLNIDISNILKESFTKSLDCDENALQNDNAIDFQDNPNFTSKYDEKDYCNIYDLSNYKILDTDDDMIDIHNVELFFGNMSISEIKTNRDKIICLHKEESLTYALKVMLTENVLFAPVYEDNQDNKSYIGMLDVSNVMNSIRINQNLDLSIAKIAGKIHCVEESANISTIIGIMKQNIRHVVVLKDKVISKIISQGAIFQNIMVKSLNLENESIERMMDKKISDYFCLQYKKELSLPDNVITLEVFEFMAKNKINSVPLLGRDGIITGIISVSDIKLFSNIELSKKQDLLRIPAIDFAIKNREYIAQTLNNIPFRESSTILTCRMNYTLRQTIEKLVLNKIHQLYIIDDQFRYINSISYTDILNILF